MRRLFLHYQWLDTVRVQSVCSSNRSNPALITIKATDHPGGAQFPSAQDLHEIGFELGNEINRFGKWRLFDQFVHEDRHF